LIADDHSNVKRRYQFFMLLVRWWMASTFFIKSLGRLDALLSLPVLMHGDLLYLRHASLSNFDLGDVVKHVCARPAGKANYVSILIILHHCILLRQLSTRELSANHLYLVEGREIG
jgi:hypothetical protein